MVYITNFKERCIILGEYIVKTNSTVRATAKQFGISKSTVHKDITKTLIKYDKSLYKKVENVLQINKQERHLRGGEATRIKYEKSRSN